VRRAARGANRETIPPKLLVEFYRGVKLEPLGRLRIADAARPVNDKQSISLVLFVGISLYTHLRGVAWACILQDHTVRALPPFVKLPSCRLL
jgi:hypothetical protein